MKTFGKTLILAATAAATFATTVPAMAQGMGDGPDRVPPFFADADTDKDGAISRAEADAMHDERFKKADRDGDGFITMQEMREARAEMMEHRGGMGDRHGERGKHRDHAKRDGHHGKKDMRGHDSARLQRLLELMDTDASGGVTQNELLAVFQKLDANGDGTVTVAETRDGMRIIMRDARPGAPTPEKQAQ